MSDGPRPAEVELWQRRPPREPEPAGEPGHVRATARSVDRIALVDLLDRVLSGGVVVAGEITLSVADVDMVTVSLRALITSVSALAESGHDVSELAR